MNIVEQAERICKNGDLTHDYAIDLAKQLQAVQEREKKLVETLMFYASEDNWRGGLSFSSKVNEDWGKKARDILLELEIV